MENLTLNHWQNNCRLCPRQCGIDRTETVGFCGANNQMEICRIMPHYFEEPPISGTKGSGTVFFAHCNLGCVFCQNYKISQNNSLGKIYSPLQLAEAMLILQSHGVHNINFVSPTHYLPLVAESILLARKKGLNLPTVYNCGGYENPKLIEQYGHLFDIFLPDYKYFSNYYAKRYSAAEDYPETAIDTLNAMVKLQPKLVFDQDGIMQKGVIIRHLILPDCVNDSKQVLSSIAKRYKENVAVSLMRQYTPVCKNLPDALNRTVTDEEYFEVLEYFNMLGLYGFAQEESSATQEMIPNWMEFIDEIK